MTRPSQHPHQERKPGKLGGSERISIRADNEILKSLGTVTVDELILAAVVAFRDQTNEGIFISGLLSGFGFVLAVIFANIVWARGKQ